MTSPTQRTLARMRKAGYRCATVEKWNPHARIRQDLFGVVDVLCIGHGETVAVQCTSYSNLPSRVRKIKDSDALADMRNVGWRVLAQGWHKRKNRWVCREVDLS